MGARRVNLGCVVDLPDNGAIGLAPKGNDDQIIALKRNGELFLWLNDCPHDHRPLELRKNHFLSPDGSYITCFAHGANFHPETGLCISGPCQGEFLVSIPFSIINDEIWADI